MLFYLRSHWRHVSTGLLALTLLGAGGVRLYGDLTDDCCQPGSPCCHPGASCCHHRK